MIKMENGETIQTPQPVNGIQRDKYLNGPDQIVPATKYHTWLPEDAVKLRQTARGLAAEPPVSVPGLLARTATLYPSLFALCSKKEDGTWHKITYKQYQEIVRTVAKGFLKLGLRRYHGVCILGFNSEQWFEADLGAIHAGGFAAGIYTTNSAEACYHCLATARANICVLQDAKQLEKILSVRDRLPHLKAIIQWEGPVDTTIPGLYSWEQLLEIGNKEADTDLDNVLKSLAVNECCTLVYTSGTTGAPKAVMLSHDNLTWDAYIISCRIEDFQPEDERMISYLPLSHIAAQILDIYTSMTKAVTLYFAQPDALRGSILETLKEVRPTRFLAVPRVFEKMYEKIAAAGASRGSLTRYIAGIARSTILEYHSAKYQGLEHSALGYNFAKCLVSNKVKEALGMDQCRIFVSAAAPISIEVKKFFLSLDIPIMEAFGMSEVAGAHSVSVYPRTKLDSVGEILGGTETKIDGGTSPNGPGEVCMRGRHLMMGYLNEKDKTNSTIDEDGWIHSGDVGWVDDQDLLYITGRIKELLITAGGENVAPVPIEQNVLSELKHLGFAVVVGDRRKFLSVLLTIRTKVDNDKNSALDELEVEAQKWVANLGSTCTTLSEISKTKDPAVYKAIEEGIAKANKKAISNAQKVQKFAVLPADFSLASGELGPTMKVKRNVVYEKYKDVIEELYSGV